MKLSILKGSFGLRTQPDPSRSPYSQGQGGFPGQIGLVDLAACMNVDITDGNMIMRRRGTVKRVPENAHSVYEVRPYCLFVVDDGLFLLKPGFSGYVQISTVTPAPVCCEVVDGIGYWSNGIQKGKVVGGVNQPWVKAATVYSNNQTRIFYDPPAGNILGYYNGRMYIAGIAEDRKIVRYSEAYGPDLFDFADAFLSLESAVTMVRPVAGGIYVSDSERTHFVSGDPLKFDWKVVDNHPALPWSSKPVVGVMSMDQTGNYVYQAGGKTEVAFWLTNEGVMFGDATGNVTNITEEKIDLLPPYTSGAILVDGSTLLAQFIK
jgi:hypothetical protein